MKYSGFLLLLSGAVILVAALVLLKEPARLAFVLAGFALQIGGVVVAALGHRPRGGSAV